VKQPFVALPPEHVAASRLGWRAARTIVARDQGWELNSLSVSRRWRFEIGRARWTAMAFVSFHFYRSGERQMNNAVFAIYFSGKGSTSELQTSPLLEALHSRLRVYRWGHDGKSLTAMSSDETKPRTLLGELDRIAAAFGAADQHRAPSSRSRDTGKRLAAVGDAVLAKGTWSLHNVSLWIWANRETAVSLSMIPKLDTMLFVPKGTSTERVTHAKARGYAGHSGQGLPEVALLKLQPLTLRAALAEAKFLESEL